MPEKHDQGVVLFRICNINGSGTAVAIYAMNTTVGQVIRDATITL